MGFAEPQAGGVRFWSIAAFEMKLAGWLDEIPRALVDLPCTCRYDTGMEGSDALAERRRHARARLRLPARVRWQGPLGMPLEITETIDVSREGVLLSCCQEPVAPGSRVWVVFPYDAAAIGTFEPETPARVVRVEHDARGECRVGLRLELHRENDSFPAGRERRAVPRVSVCLPIFVRAQGMPWPEEVMTHDFSWSGIRFETPHIYRLGETVRVKIPWGEWADAGEISARVVRIEASADVTARFDKVSTAGAAFNCVAVQLAEHG
jgi:hypothetical protein